MNKKVEISPKTILLTIALLASFWLLFQIKEIILLLFIAVVLMSALNNLVKSLEKYRLPRWLAILLIYIVFFSAIGVAIGTIVPPLIEQTTNLISRIPDLFKQFNYFGIDQSVISSQLAQLTSVPANIIRFVIGLFSNILEVLALAVITFYLLLERKNLDQYLSMVFGEENEKQIESAIEKIELKLGGWIRGEALLMLIIGILNYIGFVIIGIDYALPLAILAFFLEIIPTFGPTIAAIPAILTALTLSPLHALAVAGWAFLIQQIENSILVPRIMKSATGMNPLVTIIVIAVGLKVAGIGGGLLAVPTFIVGEIVVAEIMRRQKSK